MEVTQQDVNHLFRINAQCGKNQLTYILRKPDNSKQCLSFLANFDCARKIILTQASYVELNNNSSFTSFTRLWSWHCSNTLRKFITLKCQFTRINLHCAYSVGRDVFCLACFLCTVVSTMLWWWQMRLICVQLDFGSQAKILDQTDHRVTRCVTVRASDLRSSGPGFDSRSGRYQATIYRGLYILSLPFFRGQVNRIPACLAGGFVCVGCQVTLCDACGK